MKKAISILSILVLVLAPLLSFAATANDGIVSPCYVYTADIHAELTFSGGSAVCSGYVKPSGSYPAKITVSLYQLNGSTWTYVTGWSGSATGGGTAQAGGSYSVGSGTYRVIVAGNVNNGSEFPSTSVTKTK